MRSKVSADHYDLEGFCSALDVAALKRVPSIKPSNVDEVFFGNVLSAKYALIAAIDFN